VEDIFFWYVPAYGEWAVSEHGKHWAPIQLYLRGPLASVAAALRKVGWNEVVHREEDGHPPHSAAQGRALERTLLGLWPPPLPARFANPPLSLQDGPEPSELLYQGGLPVASYEKRRGPFEHCALHIYDTSQHDTQGRLIWAACAHGASGLRFDPLHRRCHMVPVIEKDADRERDALVEELLAAGTLVTSRMARVKWLDIGPAQPRSGDGRVCDAVVR
jgi:hypothetical protein